MEKLNFEIKLLSNTSEVCPEVIVGIDHINYFAGEVLGEKTVKFTASVADNCSLRIKFAGNNPRDLILNEQGMPTNSVQITVDTIIIEGIDVTQIAYNTSEYNINNMEKYITEYTIQECMEFSFSGVWSLPIQSPVYIWMLENL